MISLISIFYITLIVIIIIEPVKDLKPLTIQEIKDHEYEQIIVDEINTTERQTVISSFKN